MSETDVDVVRSLAEAFNRRDVEAFLELCDRGIEWFPAVSGGVEGRSYRGLDGMRAYFDDVADAWEQFEFEEGEYRDLGERVLALGEMHARGRGGGVSLDQPAALVFELHAGKCLRARSFTSHEEGTEAAAREDPWEDR